MSIFDQDPDTGLPCAYRAFQNPTSPSADEPRRQRRIRPDGWSQRADRMAQEMAANLASINEILAEMVSAAAAPEFAEVAVTTLRDHSWRLGFTFQGARPPAGWDEVSGS